MDNYLLTLPINADVANENITNTKLSLPAPVYDNYTLISVGKEVITPAYEKKETILRK